MVKFKGIFSGAKKRAKKALAEQRKFNDVLKSDRAKLEKKRKIIKNKFKKGRKAFGKALAGFD